MIPERRSATIPGRLAGLAGLAGRWPLAACALLLAGAVEAEGVEVYGRAHFAVTHVNDGGDYSAHNLASNAGRLGVYGVHRVTPELEGVARFEGEVALDTGDTRRRDVYAGFRGEWGLLRAGRYDTPAKRVARRVDLFPDQIGDSRNIIRNETGDRGFDGRLKNGVGYRSPEIHPVIFEAVYSMETEEGDAVDGNDQSAVSASLAYHGGSVYLAVAHEAFSAGDERKVSRAAASYDWRDLRVTLFYQKAEEPEDEAYGAGLRYRLSDELAVKAQHYVLDADGSDDADAAMTAVGAEFQTAPELRLYVNYARLANEPGRELAPWREGSTLDRWGVQDETAWALAVGAIFDF